MCWGPCNFFGCGHVIYLVPGDTVWWHCDLIHAVEGVHGGSEDAAESWLQKHEQVGLPRLMDPVKPFLPFVVHLHPTSRNSSNQQHEVFYIPAVPFCEKNRVYVQAQAAMKKRRISGWKVFIQVNFIVSRPVTVGGWFLMFKFVYILFSIKKVFNLIKFIDILLDPSWKNPFSAERHAKIDLFASEWGHLCLQFWWWNLARPKPSSSIARHQIFLPTTVRRSFSERILL